MAMSRAIVVSVALLFAGALSALPAQAATAQSMDTTVVLPANNATMSGTDYLDATATSGATGLQYELTGGSLSDQVIATATLTWVGWAAAWNTTTVANGSYTLTSVASYSGGLTATSAAVSVTVDNAPPSTTVVYPAAGSTLNGLDPQYFDAVASPGATGVTLDFYTSSTLITTLPASLTFVGWVGLVSGAAPNSCGPASIPLSVQSVAKYAGGVTVSSAPVQYTLEAYIPPGPGGLCTPE
jgi:hypothetical protein